MNGDQGLEPWGEPNRAQIEPWRERLESQTELRRSRPRVVPGLTQGLGKETLERDPGIAPYLRAIAGKGADSPGC